MVSPYDNDLIYGGSIFRRNLMDGIISQTDKKFLADLISYKRILEQRNALLKMNYKKPKLDMGVLEIYDEKIIDLGNIIHEKRKLFIDIYKKIFKSYYLLISKIKSQLKLISKANLITTIIRI